MKTAKDLAREQLERIVTVAQEMFWSSRGEAGEPVWHPDVEWSWEDVEAIAGAMVEAGLRPAPEDAQEDAA